MSEPAWIPASKLPDRFEGVKPRLEGVWHVGKPLNEFRVAIAIVGTRRPTPYGLEVAFDIAAGLARRGICVISGMARGIDAAAHEGALSVPGGRTLAVLGTGVDVPYPASSRPLYPRILEQGGAIVSEAPPGSSGFKSNFLARNRIVAGLSLGVVLVQAEAAKSGALATTRFATEMHLDVFAVPGDIRSSVTGGPLDLLRAGAHICANAADVIGPVLAELERAGWDRSTIAGITGDERAVIDAVVEGHGTPGSIAALTSLGPQAISRALSRLEIAGLLTRDFSGGFQASPEAKPVEVLDR